MADKKLINILKYIFIVLVIVSSIYVMYNVLRVAELIVGFIVISVGVLSIIWTLLAMYSLSPKSNLRVFTNNFLACSIAVIGFSLTRIVGQFVSIPWLILVEFFFIFVTFFFFLLASYYIYSLGREFGFQKESKKIGEILKRKRNKKKTKV